MMGSTHRTACVLFTLTGAGAANALFHAGLTLPDMAAACAIGYVAGELPDLDHRDSSITHSKLPVLWKVKKALWHVPVVGAPLASIAPLVIPLLARAILLPVWLVGMALRPFYRHRGPTHSLGFLIVWSVIALPLYWLYGVAILFGVATFERGTFSPNVHELTSLMFSHYWLIAAAVALAYLSHLVMDGLTNVPLPFLWPVSQRRSSLLPTPLRVTTDSWREHWVVLPVTLICVGLAMLAFVLPTVRQQAPRQLQAQLSAHVGR
jgi:membrane-bound metal-dependent hydrolase YbcI (DUF457 family)